MAKDQETLGPIYIGVNHDDDGEPLFEIPGHGTLGTVKQVEFLNDQFYAGIAASEVLEKRKLRA